MSASPLEVRVVIENRGDTAVSPLAVLGELLGERREARVASGVPARGSAAVVLSFEGAPPRPGLHPLLLLIEHPVEGRSDAGGNPPVESQRAFVMLALGAQPEAAVSLVAGPGLVDARGELVVTLASVDGAPHRVSVRAVPDRGLLFPGPAVLVDVPAAGTVQASLPLTRAGAARGSRPGLLVVADALDGDVARTAVITASVDVAADPSLVRLLRWPLVGLGLVLLTLAVAAEWRGREVVH